MSGGMNIDAFKLQGDGVSLSEFAAQVQNNNELINIYKAFDKNGDNKLSRDELASLLGAYKVLDINGDGTLSTLESASFNQKISTDIARDSNRDNDNLVINFNKFNDFFSSLKTLIDPNSAKSGNVYYYDIDGKITDECTREYTDSGYTDTYDDNRTRNYGKDGKWLGGKKSTGDQYTVTYNQNGSYVIKTESLNGDTDKPYEVKYNADGKIIGGKNTDGDTWTRTYYQNGSYVDKYQSYYEDMSKPYEQYFNPDGKLIGGKDSDGDTWSRIYKEDGSYVNKYQSYYGDTSKPYEVNYNADGKIIGGKNTAGNKWARTYNPNGSYVDRIELYNGDISKPYEEYYDADGKETGGKISNYEPLDTEYTVKYNAQGNATYNEYKISDGTKYFWYYDDNAELKEASTDVDANGEITTSAKEGEKFEETMKRLGITDEADIEAFRAANPRAARKGWFLAGAQDVKIPASIAKKLDYANMMVNAREQAEAYRRRISGS